MREIVQNELTDQKLQPAMLKEFVMNLLTDQKIGARITEKKSSRTR